LVLDGGKFRRRNIIKVGLEDKLKEVQVSAMLRDLLDVPGFKTVV
jgi:hypothetical protein